MKQRIVGFSGWDGQAEGDIEPQPTTQDIPADQAAVSAAGPSWLVFGLTAAVGVAVGLWIRSSS